MRRLINIADSQSMQAMKENAVYIENTILLNALYESFPSFVEKYEKEFKDNEESEILKSDKSSVFSKVKTALFIFRALYEMDNGVWLSSVYNNPNNAINSIHSIIYEDDNFINEMMGIEKQVYMTLNEKPYDITDQKERFLYSEISRYMIEIGYTVLKDAYRDIIENKMLEWKRRILKDLEADIVDTVMSISLAAITDNTLSIANANRHIRSMITDSFVNTMKRLWYDIAVEAGFKVVRYNTQHDKKVRPSHAELDGKYFSILNIPWDKLSEPNCRCYLTPEIGNFEEFEDLNG